MFSWRKLGNVFDPTVSQPKPWMQEYAQCPTPFVVSDKVLRVFIACRPSPGSDLQYVSYPGYVDLDRHDLNKVIGLSDSPLMPLGNPGAFDEFGIMPSCMVRRDDGIYAYYSGWTRMQSVPYTLSIGVAVSRDNGITFSKLGEGPTLGLSLNEPYLVTGPSVRRVGDQWLMWYLTGKKWLLQNGKQEPIYQIALAKSRDGINWKHDGTTIIPTLSENECQDMFSPFFMADKWHAIFAWRDPTSTGEYRFGYASSDDLETWVRDDTQTGIELSESGWDSKMMCYPQIIELDGRILMFYCGNTFGRGGFGIAELTSYTPNP